MTRSPPMQADLALVVAVSENGCIGRDGTLPWHLPEDLKHFRRVTEGHAIIMGRRTHESIGRPLPKRRNLVLTSQPEAVLEGCEHAVSLEAAIAAARDGGDPEPRVIGGAAVYRAALPQVTRMFLTRVHQVVNGDTFFPEIDLSTWKETSRRTSDDGQATFLELVRAPEPTR